MNTRPANLQNRVASLDLLRLVAAMAVVLFHYLFRGAATGGYLDTAYPAAPLFAIYGYLGVNLFFLISGFVIAWSAQGRTWQDFAIARFARLYPGYLACMTLTFLAVMAAGDARLAAGASIYAANLFMFAPALGRPFMDGVYWSIVLEIIFYGWIALLMLAGVFQRWKLVIIAAWLAIAAVNEFLIGSTSLRLIFITEYAPFFAVGILAQHMVVRGRTAERLALMAAAFLLSCHTLRVTAGWMLAHYGVAISLPHLVAANIAIHVLFGAAVIGRHLVAPSRLILMLGGLTYPLYLLHQNIGYLALNALTPRVGSWAALTLVLTIMLLLSYGVWRFIETPARRPLLRLLTRLSNWFTGRLSRMSFAASLRLLTQRQMAAK